MIKITKQKLRIIPLLIILFLLTTFFVACSKNANQNEDKNPPSPPAQKVWGIKYIGNSMTVDENSPLEHIEGTETILKRATKRGYLFQGWFLNENFSGDVMTKISPDFESENSFDTIYLYAKFDAESYKIIYHLNGGMLGENSPTMHTFGEKTKLVTPTLVGYSFGGWFDDDGYVENSELQPTKYTADINLSAKWNAKTFFIKYQLNGGKLGDNSPTEHEFNVETILVDAKRDGFKFEGWFDNEKFEGNALTKLGATDILSDITLYAKWSGETYKISFVDIDGSVLSTQIDEVLHTNGEETNLPSGLISNSYLRFGGWSSNIYGGGLVFENEIPSNVVLTHDANFYVNWLGDGSYQLNIDKTGYEVFASSIPQNRPFEVAEFYKGLPVLSIADDAFYKNSMGLHTVILPKSIISIGANAFREAPLTEIIFNGKSNLQKIGSGAFLKSTLERFELPSNTPLKIIETKAFYQCFNLQTLILPQTVSTVVSGIVGSETMDNKFAYTTIYVEGFEEKPSGWHSQFTGSRTGPVVVYGVVLGKTENKPFVKQFTKTAKSIDGVTDSNKGYNPTREGFKFKGYLAEDKNYKDLYDVSISVKDGTAVEVVWEENEQVF